MAKFLKVNKFNLNDIVTTGSGIGRICAYEVDKIFDHRLKEEIDEFKYKVNMHDDPTKYLSFYERHLTLNRDIEKEIADAVKAAEIEKETLAAKEPVLADAVITEEVEEMEENIETIVEKKPKKKKA